MGSGCALLAALFVMGCGGSESASGGSGVGGAGGSSGAAGFGGDAGHAAAGLGGRAAGGSSGASAGGAATGGTSGAGAGGGSAGNGAGGAATGGTSGAGAGGGSAGNGGVGGSVIGGAGGSSSGAGGVAGAAGSGASSGSAGTSSGGSAGSTGGSGTAGSAGAGGAGGATAGCTQDSDCDDGEFCNGDEACNVSTGACVAGQNVVCGNADGATCTLDICSEAARACVSIPQDSACSNSVQCDGTERCDPANSTNATGCVAGTPLDCDDRFACTTDSCQEGVGCVHTPVHSLCGNAQFCDGDELCAPGTPGANAAGCIAGTPVQCDDNIQCTTDTCDEVNDRCNSVANHAVCDDGVYCNGAETCADNGAGDARGCLVPAPVVCNDFVACTDDRCDENSQGCKFTPNQALCAPNQACVSTGCVAGTACTSDGDCNDNDACIVGERCNLSTGLCVPGTPKDCDDGVYCTLDGCDSSSGACTHTNQDIRCQDSNVCDGAETCNPSSGSSDADGCVAGTPLTCNDGYSCTDDFCSPSTGCGVTPVSSRCSDGLVCNGLEICAPGAGSNAAGCVAGTTLACPDDGVNCTTETCSEAAGGCIATPDDELCSGADTCDADLGCGNYCVVTECRGKVYACGDCLDNDGDGDVDSRDEHCIGVCHNNETGFKGEIPGQNQSPCKQDCYFDNDSGSGNDECYWSHKCDTHEVSPNYDPSGSQCSYNPSASIPGTQLTCSQAQQAQSTQCGDYCGPLTPNGCDCFGCCAIPGAATTVYLGSESGGVGSCNINTVGDPTKCRPCDQVAACLNTCEECEICLGKPTLPPQCVTQQCPAGIQACGQPGQPACALGEFCVTGCCQPAPG